MFLVKYSSDDAGTEGASGIKRASGVKYTNEFSDEEGESDSDRRNKSSLVFLFSKEEDLHNLISVHSPSGYEYRTHSKYQLKSQNSFNKDATHQRRILRQRRPHLEFRRK